MNKLFQDRIKDETSRVFTKGFIWAGVGFLMICFLGYMTNLVIDRGGIIKESIAYTKAHGTFNVDFFANGGAQAAQRLKQVSIFAIVLILVSSLLRFYWWLRFQKVSKVFIYSAFAVYIIAQGLGFGILFTTMNSLDLLIIFGSSGLMFLLMAWAGYVAKDMSKYLPFLIFGSIGVFFLGIIAMVLYFVGGASDGFIFAYFVLAGALTLVWIAFDVWWIKSFAQQNAIHGPYDELTEFRVVSFIGFRLLSDLVSLIWTVARLLRFFRG